MHTSKKAATLNPRCGPFPCFVRYLFSQYPNEKGTLIGPPTSLGHVEVITCHAPEVRAISLVSPASLHARRTPVGYPFTSVSTSSTDIVKIQLRVYLGAVMKRPENVTRTAYPHGSASYSSYCTCGHADEIESAATHAVDRCAVHGSSPFMKGTPPPMGGWV